MRDEIEGREWIAHGAAFTAFLGDLIGQTRTAFERLNARQYAAPWRNEAPRIGEPGKC